MTQKSVQYTRSTRNVNNSLCSAVWGCGASLLGEWKQNRQWMQNAGYCATHETRRRQLGQTSSAALNAKSEGNK